MNSNCEQANGGASITPSARRSIHSHVNCPFATFNESMGRYGLDNNKKREESVCPSNEQGRDEVDNVMSKQKYSASPLSRNKNTKQRRNSMNAQNQVYTDDDTDVLSKSVPSRSYCSDGSDESPLQNNRQLSDVSSQSATATPVLNRRNRSKNASFDSTTRVLESANLSRQTQINPSVTQINVTKNSSKFLILFVALIGVLITVCGSILNTKNVSNSVKYDEYRFYYDINSIGEKYNIDDNSILQVQSGISTIFERKDTGSFMFVYNSKTKSFNPTEFNNFINDVSNAAAKYLRNDSTPVHYTMVEGTKLDMAEHSELINKFRDDLTKTGVMLVKQIDAIPSALAMAFHYYCDEYNPLVKKSAIFFTLNVAKCSHFPDQKSTHAHIEKCLTKKWDSVPPDNIGPLLTRVVSVVIDLTSVF